MEDNEDFMPKIDIIKSPNKDCYLKNHCVFAIKLYEANDNKNAVEECVFCENGSHLRTPNQCFNPNCESFFINSGNCFMCLTPENFLQR